VRRRVVAGEHIAARDEPIAVGAIPRKPNDANTSLENRGSSDRLSGSATP